MLWAVPRSVSTAFERMVIERGDHCVFDEPFSAAYYHGPEARSPRFAMSDPEATVARVVAEIEAAADQQPVFVKDMASHVGPALDAAFLAPYRSALLIRDPRRTVPSMARVWPDVTEEEVGFTALERVFDVIADETGEPPIVIESDDLLADPAGVVGAWCDAMGLAEVPEALCWEAGMRPEWHLWPEWYRSAAASEGFGSPPTAPPPVVADERLAGLIQRSLPIYERLHALRVRPRAL